MKSFVPLCSLAFCAAALPACLLTAMNEEELTGGDGGEGSAVVDAGAVDAAVGDRGVERDGAGADATGRDGAHGDDSAQTDAGAADASASDRALPDAAAPDTQVGDAAVPDGAVIQDSATGADAGGLDVARPDSAQRDVTVDPTVTFSEDFSSGEWRASEWLAEKLGSNSDIEVRDGEGRLFFGTANPAWARATLLGRDTTDSDVTLQFRFEHNGTEGQLRLFLRASGAFGANGYPEVGYVASITNSSGAIALERVGGGLPATLSTGSWTSTPDLSTYSLRYQVVGTTVRVRIWLAAVAEPATWNLEVTDTEIAAAGDFRVEYFKISSARGARVDNILLVGQ